MNPELPRVHPNVEAMPQIPGGAEYFPDGAVRTHETLPTIEQQPSQVEQLTQAAQAMPQAVPVQPAMPAAPAPQAQDQQVTDNPLVAGDDDLIEKEWVDKVKKIIALTKGNPYEQAKAIAALQADYLKKRYNRELGEKSAEF